MKKMKRVLAGFLGMLMVFSIIFSGRTETMVNAADYIEVDFSDGTVSENVITYTVGEEIVTVTVTGGVVTDNKIAIERGNESNVTFTLTNFDSAKMEVQVYSEEGFQTTLAVKENQTSLAEKQNGDGGLPDALKLKVISKESGENWPPEITDPQELTVNITGDADKLESVNVDGFQVTDGKVSVQKADTHTIEIQYQLGYKFIKVMINGTEMSLDSVTDDGKVIYSEIAPVDGIYNIDVLIGAGSEKTLVWEYGEDNSLGQDATVSHGKIEIVNAGNTGITDLTENPEEGGLFSIQPGTEVTVKMIPDQGYQLKTTSLNGGENVAVDVTAADEVSTFTFIMPETNLHLGIEFEPGNDVVNTDSEKVTDGALTNVEGAINSGNLELEIKDMTPTNKQKAEIEAAAGEGTVHLYLDMTMKQVLNKGTASDAWKSTVTELNNRVTVTLKVTDDDLKSQAAAGMVYVIREHEGQLEKIPAVYNAEESTISFETDQFSTYVLASGGETNWIVIGGQNVTYQKGMVSYWNYDKETSVTTPCLEEEANIILDDTYDDSEYTYDRLEVTLKSVDIESRDDPTVSGYYREGCGLWYNSVLYLNIYGDCRITGASVGLCAGGTMRIYGKDAGAKLTVSGDENLEDQGTLSSSPIGVDGYDRIHIYCSVYSEEENTFSFITRSTANKTIENVGCTLHGDETVIITSENFDGSNPVEHYWDGESFGIGDQDQYQYIEYKVKNNPIIPDTPDEVIDTINITDATLSFKVGEAPKFTGKVAASDTGKYTIIWEGWELFDENDEIVEACYSDGGIESDKLLQTFRKGETYYYSIGVWANNGYKFADDVRLIVNGKEIDYKAGDHWLFEWWLGAYDIIDMIPTVLTEPENPSEPEDPTEPENPTNPTVPENPTDSAKPENPANPVKPENSTDPMKVESKDNQGSHQRDRAQNEVEHAVETGDQMNISLLFAVISIAGIGLVGTVAFKRRKME